MGDDPSTGGDIMNSIGKYVPTSTLSEPTWNATLLSGDIVEEVTKLKAGEENLLIYGSGQLTETLRAAGLVDEYRLLICPIVLGEGRRLFTDHTPSEFTGVTDNRTAPSGMVLLTLAKADRGGPGPAAGDVLSVTFGALADPTRRAMLSRLSNGDATVNELAGLFPAISLQAVSKHLKVLERAGLVTRGRSAQRRPAHLRAAPLVDVSAWLEHLSALLRGLA